MYDMYGPNATLRFWVSKSVRGSSFCCIRAGIGFTSLHTDRETPAEVPMVIPLAFYTSLDNLSRPFELSLSASSVIVCITTKKSQPTDREKSRRRMNLPLVLFLP